MILLLTVRYRLPKMHILSSINPQHKPGAGNGEKG
jgi:hypothetical protein